MKRHSSERVTLPRRKNGFSAFGRNVAAASLADRRIRRGTIRRFAGACFRSLVLTERVGQELRRYSCETDGRREGTMSRFLPSVFLFSVRGKFRSACRIGGRSVGCAPWRRRASLLFYALLRQTVPGWNGPSLSGSEASGGSGKGGRPPTRNRARRRRPVRRRGSPP